MRNIVKKRSGGIPLYKSYMFVPPKFKGVWFLRRFGLKIGYRFFFPFESGIRYGFQGNYGTVLVILIPDQ